jgi:hypothetical protein
MCTKGMPQIVLLDSFDPSGVNDLCGVGYDPDSFFLWIYPCSSEDIQRYSTAGVLLSSVPAAGGSANAVDVEMAPEPLFIGATFVSEGQLLFINGETDSADIFAIDQGSGAVVDTLITSFGDFHVVGGSYHPDRNTFFLVQDNVPAEELENLIAEIDPLTGDTLQTFQVTDFFSVSFGDLEVGSSGNLFVVSSVEDSIAEFTPEGVMVKMHALPTDVSVLSGIALDCAMEEAWVVSTTGMVYHLGQFPCGEPSNTIDITNSKIKISTVSPNPFRDEFNISISMQQAASLRLTLSNIYGQEVQVIFDGRMEAVEKVFTSSANELAQGVYLLKAETNEFTATQSVVCVK